MNARRVSVANNRRSYSGFAFKGGGIPLWVWSPPHRKRLINKTFPKQTVYTIGQINRLYDHSAHLPTSEKNPYKTRE